MRVSGFGRVFEVLAGEPDEVVISCKKNTDG